MNVFAPPVFFLYEHTGGLSLEPFYFHNFTACFPCWDVPHWIRQCRSFIRRLLLNYICHVLATLHFPPAHPKWSWKGKDRSCTLTQVFFRGDLHGTGERAQFNVPRPGAGGWQGAVRGGCLLHLPSFCQVWGSSGFAAQLQSSLLRISMFLPLVVKYF